MPRLNEKEVKQILALEDRKRDLTLMIDIAINELSHIRTKERTWWKGVVEKYKLDKVKMHRIWIDGEILEERRISHGKRKVF